MFNVEAWDLGTTMEDCETSWRGQSHATPTVLVDKTYSPSFALCALSLRVAYVLPLENAFKASDVEGETGGGDAVGGNRPGESGARATPRVTLLCCYEASSSASACSACINE